MFIGNLVVKVTSLAERKGGEMAAGGVILERRDYPRPCGEERN